MSDILFLLAVFIISFSTGYVLISRIPAMLHTPLMSMTNAISAVVILGAMLLLAAARTQGELYFTLAAIIAASFNVIGGFFITDRMLKMFKKHTSDHVSGRSRFEK